MSFDTSFDILFGIKYDISYDNSCDISNSKVFNGLQHSPHYFSCESIKKNLRVSLRSPIFHYTHTHTSTVTIGNAITIEGYFSLFKKTKENIALSPSRVQITTNPHVKA